MHLQGSHFWGWPLRKVCATSDGVNYVIKSPVVAVLVVRTYAVWKRDKRVGAGLALLFILCQISMGIITERWIGVAILSMGLILHSFSALCLCLRVLNLPPSQPPSKILPGTVPLLQLREEARFCELGDNCD